MTDQNEIVDKEQLNTQEDEYNTDEIPSVTSVDDVEPISDDELFELALVRFHNGINNNQENKERADKWYKMYFGKDYTSDDVNSSLDNEHQQEVVGEYIYDQLKYLIKLSTSLDSDKTYRAINKIFDLVGYHIDVSQSDNEAYDTIFKKRASDIELLGNVYKALKINRDIAEIYEQNKNITNLSRLVAKMEDLSFDMKAFYKVSKNDTALIDNEIMARFYYNISEVYDATANSKNNLPEISKWEYRSMQYKKKALGLTTNIETVSNIQNTWQYYGDYNPQKVTGACERIIDNPSSDECTLYRAHKLYADTLANMKIVDVFNGRQKRYEDAVLHYHFALQHTKNPESKLEILNNISKIQKHYPNKEDYVRTRLELSELLHERQRVRERLDVSDYVKDEKLKAAILKSCINEYQEFNNITDEDRRTYDKVDAKIREVIPADDKKTLKTLDTLKKKYGQHDNKNNEFLFPTMSSSGKDFF